MADTKGTAGKPGASTTKATASGAKPSAILGEFDFDSAADPDALAKAASQRSSKWTEALDKLYTATAEGKVPRNEAGALKFVKLGHFGNVGGARTQVRVFEKAGLNKTYEFKTVTTKDPAGSDLWARVVEVAAAPATAGATA